MPARRASSSVALGLDFGGAAGFFGEAVGCRVEAEARRGRLDFGSGS